MGLSPAKTASPARIELIAPSFNKHQRLAPLPSSATNTLAALCCKSPSLVLRLCVFTNNAAWRFFRAPETRASNTSCIAGRPISSNCSLAWLDAPSQGIAETQRSRVRLVGAWPKSSIACCISSRRQTLSGPLARSSAACCNSNSC